MDRSIFADTLAFAQKHRGCDSTMVDVRRGLALLAGWPGALA
jgi:hypothetical protein